MSATWNFAKRPFQDDRPAVAAAALLFFAGAVLLFFNVRMITRDRRAVADVRAEIAALEGRQRAAEEKARAAKAALSSYRLSAMADESRELSRIAAERRFSWTTLLARLERTLPSEIGISRLQPQFEKDGSILLSLQLVAKNRDAVVPTIAALAHDPVFGSVQLQTEAVSEGGNTDPFQFQVTATYAPPGAPPPAPTKTEKKARP